TICDGESVTLPDGTEVNTSGSYDVTLPSVITGCDSTITTNVSVNELVSTQNLVEECSANETEYTVSFEIVGGDPSSYIVSGTSGSITPGTPAVFVSDPIPEGTSYLFQISDGNACNTISLNGSISCSC